MKLYHHEPVNFQINELIKLSKDSGTVSRGTLQQYRSVIDLEDMYMYTHCSLFLYSISMVKLLVNIYQFSIVILKDLKMMPKKCKKSLIKTLK